MQTQSNQGEVTRNDGEYWDWPIIKMRFHVQRQKSLGNATLMSEKSNSHNFVNKRNSGA